MFQSAASLCIGIGSFADPPDIPGFAHFLEHSMYLSLSLTLSFSFSVSLSLIIKSCSIPYILSFYFIL